MIVAVCSCYREGPGLLSTAASARAGCDAVFILEGPVGEAPETGEPSPVEQLRQADYLVSTGEWESDAAKRTWALSRIRELFAAKPLWVLWLDGDEVLIWPEYLNDWCHRAEAETGAGGFALRLVELDGSVVKTYGKIIRADVVKAYLHSSYAVRLAGSGLEIALPNVPICSAGGVPILPHGQTLQDVEDQAAWLAECRPPLQGEPHLLHRSALRDPGRTVQRQSDAEAQWFQEVSSQ